MHNHTPASQTAADATNPHPTTRSESASYELQETGVSGVYTKVYRGHHSDSQDISSGDGFLAHSSSAESITRSKLQSETAAVPINAGDDLSQGPDAKLPLFQAIRRYPKVVGYCVGMTMGATLGYNLGLVVTGAIQGQDNFMEDYGDEFDGKLNVPYVWTMLWLTLTPIGSSIGYLVGGSLQDTIGRRLTLITGSLISAVGVALMFFSHRGSTQAAMRIIMTVGVAIQGISTGFIKNTTTTWVSENAPTSLRGPVMALFPVSGLIGQLIGLLLMFFTRKVQGRGAYLGCFGAQWVFSAVTLIVGLTMPDSPLFLLRKGRSDLALRATRRLFMPKTDPMRALARFRATIEEERSSNTKVSYVQVFRGANLRRTMLTLLGAMIPTIFGLDLLSMGSLFLVRSGMNNNVALMIMAAGLVVGLFTNAAGMWILSRCGRRPMTIYSLGGAAVLWTLASAVGFWKSQTHIYITAAATIAVIAVSGVGSWPASYAILGDASSLQMRATTLAATGVVTEISSVVFGIALPALFQPDAAGLGAKTGFIYTGLCVIGVILCYFVLPEMKDRTAIELNELFEMRVPARKFKDYVVVSKDTGVSAPFVGENGV